MVQKVAMFKIQAKNTFRLVGGVVQKKPLFYPLVVIGYLFALGLLKWQVMPPWSAGWFLLGGLLGVYFLDLAELFFRLSPSPFRTIQFIGPFVVISLFVITSSGSFLASGLVLSLYLKTLLWQIGEWYLNRNLNSWYRLVAFPVAVYIQQWILIVLVTIFLFESFLFLR